MESHDEGGPHGYPFGEYGYPDDVVRYSSENVEIPIILDHSPNFLFVPWQFPDDWIRIYPWSCIDKGESRDFHRQRIMEIDF